MQEVNYMICPSCGMTIPGNKTACSNCGWMISQANINSSVQKQELLEKLRQERKQPLSDFLKFGGFLAIALIIFLLFQFRGKTFSIPENLFISPFEKKRIILFEPDCLQTQNCDEQLLKDTANSLTERANALGYDSTGFKVIGNKMISGKVPNDTDINLFAEKITSIHTIEFVDFGETFMPTDTIVQTSTNSVVVDDETIFLTVLSSDHIENAQVITNPSSGDLNIQLDFNAEGAKILTEYTATHIGQYLGIVLDKKVISCPIINSAIPGGSAVIQGDFTYESASELAGFLSAKPLPYELTLHELE